jgi:hypothetical protein
VAWPIASLTLLVVSSVGLPAQDAGQKLEYRVKAAFLYNFARFVTWPEREGTAAPVIIGILGRDPFGNVLESTIAGKTVSGRPFLVRRLQTVEEAANCQLVFVSSSERRTVAEVIEALDGQPVLTIGEAEGFVERGGMIGFVIEDQAVRIDVNLDAAQAAGLQLSSQLLRVARSIQPSGRGERQ